MKPEKTVEKLPVSKWTIIKKKMKKIFILTGLIIVFFLGIFLYWKYFYTYSEGFRAGLLQKFSRKGTIFKTYEGEMILSSIRGQNDMVIASEKFFFSVTNKNLASSLDTLQGLNVIVHYHQKNSPLIWKGDTPYYVDSVQVR
jgi:hypothetical protein